MLQRLKKIRKKLGLNQTDFAKVLGITQTSYSMIENGNRPLPERYIKVICSTFSINEEWLKVGTGNMFISSIYEKEIIEILSHLTTETKEYLLVIAKELLKTQQKLLDNKELKIIEDDKSTNDNDFDIDKEVESYRHELELERKATDELSASQEERKHA